MINLIGDSHKVNVVQILPDVFEDDIMLKKALVLKVDKKKTGLIVGFLQQVNGLNSDKIYLNSTNSESISTDDFKYGKLIKNSKFYDVSFLKRVKQINEEENLVLIGFIDV